MTAPPSPKTPSTTTPAAEPLDADGLARPLGAEGGPYADEPMAALIVHLNREVMHRGGEIALLRDLYRATAADAHRLRR
ncbi:hypothetical protein QEZ54_35530 [Catellatospora sp. KI3]|uniref:hypothetical protein n=1 Tax=Catellatospora sp. KI3 TaxID=3041620 RepID=UPI0024825F54|nr:hypothetical protein [Catellatospora sp. KI3]MDI1466303.1 hypothetical protein [Catellatospora sp. KI3]